MQNNKIIRSVCYFADTLDAGIVENIDRIAHQLAGAGYEIQTKRICSTGITIKEIDSAFHDPSLYLSVGSLKRESARYQLMIFSTPKMLPSTLI